MYVGVMRLGLMVPGARTLKDKRRVVLSFKERVQGRFKVSIAEVGALEHPRHATLGVAVVSNDAAVCDSVLGAIAGVAGTLPDAVLADRAVEIVPFGAGGTGVRGGIEQALDHGPDRDHDEADEEP